MATPKEIYDSFVGLGSTAQRMKTKEEFLSVGIAVTEPIVLGYGGTVIVAAGTTVGIGTSQVDAYLDELIDGIIGIGTT